MMVMAKKFGPVELTFETRDDYLYARAKGETTALELEQQCHNELAGKCHEVKAGRLMLVRDIPVALQSFDIFEMAKSIVDDLSGIRFACVNPYPANADPLHFGTIVALNRGVVYKVFDNEADAEEWLLSN